MRRIVPLRILAFLALFVWMAVIFGFSAENAEKSTETSDRVINNVAEVVVPEYRDYTPVQKTDFISRVSYPVRKAGHFSEYAVLGFLAFLCALTFPLKTWLRLLSPAVFCALYASLDEWHQTFSEGRSAQLFDVGIDSLGAVCGILVAWLIAAVIARAVRRRAAR